MSTFTNFLMDHQDRLVLVVIIAIFSIIATYLIYWITDRNKFTKYILGLVLIFIALYSLYSGLTNITQQAGISQLTRAIYTGVAGLVSLCFAMILGLAKRPRKKRRVKKRRRGRTNG